MAQASSLLFVLGVIATALGFAAHVGHAVLLANGRRAVVLAPARRPAFATGGVTGSFVTSRAAAASAPGRARRLPPPRSRVPRRIVTPVAFALLVASLVLRGIVVGRGPYGNLYEFSVAFAASILGGYLFLATRYPIRQIGFIPVGVALAMLLYASSLPSEIEPLVPALQNAPLLTIHVGHGGDLVRDLRDVLRGGRGVSRPGHRTTASAGCPRTRRSTRSRTARSSSASRSSRR